MQQPCGQKKETFVAFIQNPVSLRNSTSVKSWFLLPEHMAKRLKYGPAQHSVQWPVDVRPVKVTVMSWWKFSLFVRNGGRQMEELEAFNKGWKDVKWLSRGSAWGPEQQSTHCGWHSWWRTGRRCIKKRNEREGWSEEIWRLLQETNRKRQTKKQFTAEAGRRAGNTWFGKDITNRGMDSLDRSSKTMIFSP